MHVLIDCNVFRHAALSQWEHFEDDCILWGSLFVAFRKYRYVHKAPSSLKICREIPFVPSLSAHAELHGIKFFTYQFMEIEKMNIRTPCDWNGRRIDGLFDVSKLNWEHDYNGILLHEKLTTTLRRHIQRISDSRLLEIKSILGSKSDQDSCHILFCERNKIDTLLTLDYKLINKFRENNHRLKSTINIMAPSELCNLYNIPPVDEQWFTRDQNPIRNTRIVQLFARRATLRDRIFHYIYTKMRLLRRKFDLDFRFKF